MSIYYIVVNRNKKEYIDNSDLPFGLGYHAYWFFTSPLIGYLALSDHLGDDDQYNPNDEDFSFRGHWFGDPIELVSEYTEIYDIAQGLDDEKIDGKWVQRNKEESDKWINITKPLVKEWNREVEDYDEETVKKLRI